MASSFKHGCKENQEKVGDSGTEKPGKNVSPELFFSHAEGIQTFFERQFTPGLNFCPHAANRHTNLGSITKIRKFCELGKFYKFFQRKLTPKFLLPYSDQVRLFSL